MNVGDRIEIEITQDDIDKATTETTKPDDICASCLVAQALIRMGYTHVWVRAFLSEGFKDNVRYVFTHDEGINGLTRLIIPAWKRCLGHKGTLRVKEIGPQICRNESSFT